MGTLIEDYHGHLSKNTQSEIVIDRTGIYSMNDTDIDIIITWVDGNDPDWKKEKNTALKAEMNIDDSVAAEVRYRDWDNLQYIFRGIERFMPWVRKIHFVTWGHLPEWLDINAPKLHIVKHSDFIPKRYLPTFNSNTIELNLHRIPGLTERFINFNDDMFVIKETRPEDFFEKGLPKDMACISPQPIQRSVIANIELNNLKLINSHFSKKNVIKNKRKWIKPFQYGQYTLRTIIFLQFSSIIGIFEPHLPFSYLRSVINDVWEKEYKELDHTCQHKFRTVEDVNEWLFRSWQLMSGRFEPRRSNFGKLIAASDIELVQKAVFGSSYKVICINDDEHVVDFEGTRLKVNAILGRLLPDKSKFEK